MTIKKKIQKLNNLNIFNKFAYNIEFLTELIKTRTQKQAS